MNLPAMPGFLATQSLGEMMAAARVETGTSGHRISIRQQRFTRLGPDTGKEGFFLSIDDLDFALVAVNPHMTARYFENDWKPDVVESPSCFSFNGTTPDKRALHPCSSSCAVCPMAQWGSATSKLTGKGVKACRQFKSLAVIELVSGELCAFDVPPASLDAWAELLAEIDKLSRQTGRQLEPWMFVIRASFVPGVNGILKYSLQGYIDEELFEVMKQHQDEGAYMPWIGTDPVSQELRPLEVHAPSAALPAPEFKSPAVKAEILPPEPASAPAAEPAKPRRRVTSAAVDKLAASAGVTQPQEAAPQPAPAQPPQNAAQSAVERARALLAARKANGTA